ncbi:MAG: VWA domain-containing protein [Caldilineaceae bacterium]|nr:VWA domain-containing protein [Caldilineaceae bacterium]
MLYVALQRRSILVSLRVSFVMLVVVFLAVSSVGAQSVGIDEEVQQLAALYGLEPKVVADMLVSGIPVELVNQETAAAYLSEVDVMTTTAGAISPQLSASQQSSLTCDPQIYHGVRHCTDDNGDTHLLLVDLTNPHVRVQTVLPTNANDQECNSVNSNGHPNPASRDTTSNCTHPYPRKRVKEMLARYVDGFRVGGYSADKEAVAIINTDYFGADQWGPQGLAVRLGERLDGGAHNDDDAGAFHGSTQPSLAFSPSNIATIGVPGSEEVINQNLSGRYFNTVGGAPMIVDGGQVVNRECTYPYPGQKCADASQSAAGLTDDGRLVLISARKTAEDIATYLINNHRVQTALKFDGGGSVSMAWVNSDGEVDDFCSELDPGQTACREVTEGLLIFSDKIQPSSLVDVALIIDSSGSMSWNDDRNKRLEAARAYLNASAEGDFVGIVDFDDTARLASPLDLAVTRILGVRRINPDLLDAIDTIDASGGTDVGIGVQEGCDALIASPSGNHRKAAILLTDGQGGFTNEDVCLRDRGWPIYTFGFGDSDDALLQQIATDTGGEFRRLPTSDLVCEFQRVRSKIANVEPGPCTSYRVGPYEFTIFYVPVPSGQLQVAFSTSWLGSDVEMKLTSPSGRVIDRNTVAPDVVHDLGAAFETYTVLNPEPGDWEVSLYGADVPTNGEEVVFGLTTLPLPEGGSPDTLHLPLLATGSLERGGGSLYSDDFSNAKSGWPAWENELARLSYQSGEYEVYVKEAGWLWRVVAPAARFEQAVVEFDLRLVQGWGVVNGVSFDHVAPRVSYAFFVDDAGYFTVQKLVNNQWQVLQSWQSSPHIKPANEVNRLRIDYGAGRYTFSINGQQLVQGTEFDLHGEADVGLFISTYTGSTVPLVIRYDNFSIRAVP